MLSFDTVYRSKISWASSNSFATTAVCTKVLVVTWSHQRPTSPLSDPRVLISSARFKASAKNPCFANPFSRILYDLRFGDGQTRGSNVKKLFLLLLRSLVVYFLSFAPL